MKALRILGIIILILIAVFLIVPFFLADNVVVTHTEIIKAKPETIFRQVNNLHNWDKWSPFDQDPTMVNTYEGPDQGIGAKRTWAGDKVGEGYMQIEVCEPYEYIQNKLVFGPNEGGGVGSWNFTQLDEGVEVSWTTHVKDLSYPLNRWFGLMTEPMLKPMLESGLAKLKKITEAMPQPPEIKTIYMEKQPSLIIYDSTDMAGMGEMLSTNFTALFEYIKRRKVPITGQHFAMYHKWNPAGITYISTGIPVAEGTKGYKNVQYYEIPAGNVLFTKHTGGLNSGPTHYAIDDYIKDFNLKIKDYIWETYLYNTETDKDTTKYVTFIYYPIED